MLIFSFRSQAQMGCFLGTFMHHKVFFICVTTIDEDWVPAIQPHPSYDIHLFKRTCNAEEIDFWSWKFPFEEVVWEE